MRIGEVIIKTLIMAALVLVLLPVTVNAEVDDLEKALYTKGGIVYPHTGDSTQVIFRTPPNITDYLKPGMLLGVLPEDCISASHGKIGEYYVCPHDLSLKPTDHGGKSVYEVIESR